MATKTELYARLTQAEARIAQLTARDNNFPLAGPRDVVAALRQFAPIAELEQETMWVILLSARHYVLHIEIVAIGTISEVAVHPRDIFRAAVRWNAHAIILAHNHPSGDCTPSPADHALTARIAEAGRLLGISLLDHIVVTATSHRSCKRTDDEET